MAREVAKSGDVLNGCVFIEHKPKKETKWGTQSVGRFLCHCGKEFVANVKDVKAKNTSSCGCLKTKSSTDRFKTHGLSKTNEYNIWIKMKDRCSNKNSRSYKNYGARGIFVCDRWCNSFKFFLKDMGNRPSIRHSIERKDNNGPYAPWNCHWATVSEQSLNRRNNRRFLHNGEFITIKELSDKYRVSYNTLRARLVNGWSVEEAVFTPIRHHKPGGNLN